MTAGTARLRLLFIFLLCAYGVPLSHDAAFCAPSLRDIHGSWVIDLGATADEDLRRYFGGDDERAYRAKASSCVVTFDAVAMRCITAVADEKDARHILRIQEEAGRKRIVWLRQVKFPVYIVALPDARLLYGSDWGTPWELVLRRRDAGAAENRQRDAGR
jgi:hypothetical protein